MTRNHVLTTVSLSVALALGACGGGEPEVEAVDPTAPTEAAESVSEESAVAPEEDLTVEEEPTPTVAVAEEAADGWTAMQENWESSAGLVKDRWAELTEEEILGTDGDREQLVVLVQERYGIEREQAEQEVNDWAEAL